MKQRILKYMVPALACIAAVTGCATDNTCRTGNENDAAIRLQGISTRAGTAGDTPINLMAFNDDNTEVYFSDAVIRTANALNETTPEDFTFVNGMRYYPLGGKEINLFGYTGDLDESYDMKLESGKTEPYDFLLSNYGSRKSDNGTVNDSYEGSGTPGSSADPAHILQFRHVMTQLTIEIEISQDESIPVDPAPKKVEIEMDGIYRYGRYPITAVTPDTSPGADPVNTAAPYGRTLYKATLGNNYLVPSGLNMVGEIFKSLVIDDYKATDDDLAEFKLAGSNAETEMYLYPGYSYKLKLIIKRLKLVGVVLEQVEWDPKPVNGTDPTYDPNQLAVNFSGGYVNSGSDKITKMVLHSTSGYQYVGDADDADGLINFVTLPKEAIDSVDIYTSQGLLLTMEPGAGDYDWNAGTLDLQLSEVGMLLETPGGINGPTNRYLITTVAQFLNVGKKLDGYYLQKADIELEEPGVMATDFTGFGEFTGRYEGNGHWIANANFNAAGLFAVNRGELINIRIHTGNRDLSGHNYAGSICGVNYGLIYACVNEASLFNAPTTVGGICGLNETTGRVIACLNTGNIRSGTVEGGICGENRNKDNGVFVSCLNTGNLQAMETTITGGLVGYTEDSSNIVIRTCFWLVGTAQPSPGHPDDGVGDGYVEMYDTSDLDPAKMRNGLDDGETETDRILYRLNTELDGIVGLSANYRYIYDEDGVDTGITWPMPYDINQL